MFEVSPLSPERVCAMALSSFLIKSGVSRDHLYAGFDFFAWDQRGPIGHDFANWRATVAKPCRARRSIEHQRNQFPREAVHSLPILRPHAYPQLNLGRI